MTGSRTTTSPDATNTQKGTAELIPVSTFDVQALSRIKSVEFISEKDAITALIHQETGETLKSQIISNATVKRSEVIFDLEDPRHVTVYTY
jgi:hypothetical protein